MKEVNFIEEEINLKIKYDKIKPLLMKWGSIIDTHLLNIIEKSGFNLDKVQIKPKSRIKTDESLIKNSFYRYPKISSDPLRKIEDKIATRIVVSNLNDLAKIKKVILEDSTIWTVRESRSLDKNLKKPKEFDYQALHLNLTPLDSVEEFKNKDKDELEYYTCELQVRTLLQHAFAEVAHDTVYKGPFNSENRLVRTLSTSMALMEATDEYFCKAFQIMSEENIFEKSFLENLVKFSDERLTGNTKFNPKNIDISLTFDAFKNLSVKDIDIEDLRIVLIQQKTLIEKALKSDTTYLKDQPVILFIFYLIFEKNSFIKENWFLDIRILKNLFFKLGYSFGD